MDLIPTINAGDLILASKAPAFLLLFTLAMWGFLELRYRTKRERLEKAEQLVKVEAELAALALTEKLEMKCRVDRIELELKQCTLSHRVAAARSLRRTNLLLQALTMAESLAYALQRKADVDNIAAIRKSVETLLQEEIEAATDDADAAEVRMAAMNDC